MKSFIFFSLILQLLFVVNINCAIFYESCEKETNIKEVWDECGDYWDLNDVDINWENAASLTKRFSTGHFTIFVEGKNGEIEGNFGTTYAIENTLDGGRIVVDWYYLLFDCPTGYTGIGPVYIDDDSVCYAREYTAEPINLEYGVAYDKINTDGHCGGGFKELEVKEENTELITDDIPEESNNESNDEENTDTPDDNETDEVETTDFPDDIETNEVETTDFPDDIETDEVETTDFPDDIETDEVETTDFPDDIETDEVETTDFPDDIETDEVETTDFPDDIETDEVENTDLPEDNDDEQNDIQYHAHRNPYGNTTSSSNVSKEKTTKYHPYQCGEGIGKCKEGYCCSKYGWCGKTNEYCSVKEGCQSEFGICNNSSTSEDSKEKTTKYHPYQCGEGIGKCKKGYCCSKYGWCGKTNVYCNKEKGCQSEFGICL